MKWPWLKTKTNRDQSFTATLPGTEGAHAPRLDVGSETWIFIRRYSEKRIQELRETNDGPLDDLKTATVRGQIRTFKEILGLPKPKPSYQEREDDD